MATKEDVMKRADSELIMLGRLYQADLETLKETVDTLEIKVSSDVRDQRVPMVKAINDWYNTQKAGDDKGYAAFLLLDECLRPDNASSTTDMNTNQGSTKQNTQQSDTKADVNAKPVKGDANTPKVGTQFRKEFKIYGSIDTKKGLAFVSLVRQINNGLKKGYTDIEILDAVIRAVPIGTGLRNYLEGKQDLKLPSLRQILRAHYKEKSATELCSQLGQLAQGTNEDASEFLLRALEFRQKILFTSKEESADVKYEETLVNKMFSRTVYTGLRNDVIRSEMKALLDQTVLDEEELIQTLSILTLKEDERLSKLSKSSSHKSNSVNVATVETKEADNATNDLPPTKGKTSVKEGTLTCEVRELRAEVAALRDFIRDRQNESGHTSRNEEGGRKRPTKRMCAACSDQGMDRCSHCWKCGSSEHFRAGCRAKNVQGNGQGTQPRGRQESQK